MLRIDAIVRSPLNLRLEEPVNPEATEWRCPSILHLGGENRALGMRLTDELDLESPRERLLRQRQEWTLVLCRSKPHGRQHGGAHQAVTFRRKCFIQVTAVTVVIQMSGLQLHPLKCHSS